MSFRNTTTLKTLYIVNSDCVNTIDVVMLVANNETLEVIPEECDNVNIDQIEYVVERAQA